MATLLRLGDRGSAVAELRARLAALGLLDAGEPREEFDETLDLAVRSFQQERGITVDGIVGPDTLARLEEARWQLGDRLLRFIPGHLVAGDDVAQLQRRLNELGFDAGRIDGRFGRQTDAALREFQRSCGLRGDGTCGPETFRAFERLVRTVSGGQAIVLREHVELAELRTGIADKVVVIDPGWTVAPELCYQISSRVEGRLSALGTQVLLTRGTQAGRSEPERAEFANAMSAHLVVSVNIDEVADPRPNGTATFYYGDPRGGTHSPGGRVLADLLQSEVVNRSGLLDCRTHPRNWDLLRMTRMPAVRIELGYLSNEQDALILRDARQQDALAEAIADAITRFCSPR